MDSGWATPSLGWLARVRPQELGITPRGAWVAIRHHFTELGSYPDTEALTVNGGGIWSRLAKRIELSDEARSALGIADEELTPAELMRAFLAAPVDLLFAGGIGTFVRASTERDADVADRANTVVGVAASQLRARVVVVGPRGRA